MIIIDEFDSSYFSETFIKQIEYHWKVYRVKKSLCRKVMLETNKKPSSI